MSFLHSVRLAFQGTFQADVSTVNNDVRHFDNATFIPSYQEFQKPGHVENGWWNPTGSGAFRLLGCRITGAWYGDGTSATTAEEDPIIGMLVGGSSDRTSGKIVDIDPQWQLASALWGLDVRLGDGASAWLAGRYAPNAFRDLWFSRLVNAGGDGAASATFQSVLSGVAWDRAALGRSRALRELRAASAADQLSIRLATFGYQDDVRQSGFTIGTMLGAIGPYLAGEPASFVRGRRFTPVSGFASWTGITWFTGSIDEETRTLLLDLSNALQITDTVGTPNDIGPLFIGALKDDRIVENTPVTTDTFESFAEIPYRDANWLQATGGVFAVKLSEAQVALCRGAPLALVVRGEFNPGAFGTGKDIVAIRESTGGLSVGAEPNVLRVDAPGRVTATIHATRYGAPLGGAEVRIAQSGPSPGQGGGSNANPNPPPAPIPVAGVPEDAIVLPATVETAADGTAQLDISASDPGNPRGYIDGQLYMIDYRLPGQSNQERSGFDYVVVHVRDAFTVPDAPTWKDIEPIFVQYGNLYPIMSKRLVNLANPADVKAHAQLLLLAFTREIDDPNYMPVTRDLSENKRLMIVKWLEQVISAGDPSLDAAPAVPTGASLQPPPRPPPDAAPPEGSKTQFARKLLRNRSTGGQP